MDHDQKKERETAERKVFCFMAGFGIGDTVRNFASRKTQSLLYHFERNQLRYFEHIYAMLPIP